LRSSGRANETIQRADHEEARPLVREVLSAWQARDAFVEEFKNDFVLAYLWVKYNDHHRSFSQARCHKKLSTTLDSQ